MKRHRLTKITVKTRETILLPRSGGDARPVVVCPVCQTPIEHVPSSADGIDPPFNPSMPNLLPPLDVAGNVENQPDEDQAQSRMDTNRREDHDHCQS